MPNIKCLNVKSDIIIIKEDRQLFNKLGWCNCVPDILQEEVATGMFCHSDTGKLFLPSKVIIPKRIDGYVDPKRLAAFKLTSLTAGPISSWGESDLEDMLNAFFSVCKGVYTGRIYINDANCYHLTESSAYKYTIKNNIITEIKTRTIGYQWELCELYPVSTTPQNEYMEYMQIASRQLYPENIQRWDQLSNLWTHSKCWR